MSSSSYLVALAATLGRATRAAMRPVGAVLGARTDANMAASSRAVVARWEENKSVCRVGAQYLQTRASVSCPRPARDRAGCIVDRGMCGNLLRCTLATSASYRDTPQLLAATPWAVTGWVRRSTGPCCAIRPFNPSTSALRLQMFGLSDRFSCKGGHRNCEQVTSPRPPKPAKAYTGRLLFRLK
jgi:hypothetical protein